MGPGEWIVSLSGTPEGGRLAFVLVLMAAVLHAVLSAMQKGRFEPWISRAAIDVCYGAAMAPVALFIVPFPAPHVWPILAAAGLSHTISDVLTSLI